MGLFFSEKEISITYSEYAFVALGTQYAVRMRRIKLSSASCLALPYFSTLSVKRRDFRKKGYKMYYKFFFIYSFCLKRLLLWEEFRAILSEMYTVFHTGCGGAD